jgi:hypothetical protein
VVGYGSFSLWVIHKEDLCPSSRDINRLIIKNYNGTLNVNVSKEYTIMMLLKCHNNWHRQPINVPTAGPQAFLMDNS